MYIYWINSLLTFEYKMQLFYSSMHTITYNFLMTRKPWWNENDIDLDNSGTFSCLQTSKLLQNYHKTSNISRTVVSNKIVDNSDVAGASPVGAAPTTSSFTWLQWIERRQLQEDTRDIWVCGFGATYTRGFTVLLDIILWGHIEKNVWIT